MSHIDEPLVLRAILGKVQTLQQGGWRLALECPQTDIDKMAQVVGLSEQALIVTVMPADLIKQPGEFDIG